MNDYGWYGKTNYEQEYESNDRGAYDRIAWAIYQKGRNAAKASIIGGVSKCPYKRKDFCDMWHTAYEYELIKNRQEP